MKTRYSDFWLDFLKAVVAFMLKQTKKPVSTNALKLQ